MAARGLAVLFLTGLATAVEARGMQTQVAAEETVDSLASLLLSLNPVRPASMRPAGRHAAARMQQPNPVAICKTTMGEFKVELYLDKMPITVSNFIDLAQSGYYNGIHFHRVIPNFMAQFGCPKTKDANAPMAGTGGPDGNTEFKNLADGSTVKRNAGGCIPDELTAEISNEPGTFSMANTGRPDSGGSQFFINVKHNSFLDWFDKQTPSAHPVFGKVVENFDLIKDITEVNTKSDRPVEPIMMESITIAMP